jgi:hypothetical protein
MQYDFLYERDFDPFGKTWEKWAAMWCNWLLSIPKKKNPALDETGKYCSMNQNNENVWFLTGTFGNIGPVKRKCTIPAGKAIFLPILEKEDSFREDRDLKTEEELKKRSRDATNRLIHMEAAIDGEKIDRLENYRVQSEVFDLTFPEDNVYDIRPGLTRSVCDGYWLFIKPLQAGKHYVYFKGETSLDEAFTLTQLKSNEVYNPIWQHINEKSTFKLEVSYELTITSEDRV